MGRKVVDHLGALEIRPMSDSGGSLPPTTMLVQHPVADFETWKAAFDEHEAARRAAGILGHLHALSDVDRAKEFAGSEDLKATMQAVGVTGPPSFIWMTPVRESIA